MDAVQFTKSTNGTIITVGKPYLFKSGIYGDTAVHVTAIHGDVIHFTIDGGEASRQVRDFPELSDGKYFAVSERIVKRPSKRSLATEVKNIIRDVQGVGKVAVITPVALPHYTADELEKMPIATVRRYAREHHSTIGKLTKKADIIAAIRKMETLEVETF